jgi:transcriptional regulator with AAA-type ATPase domain
MKRIDRIYNYIETNSKKFTKNNLLADKGFSAQEIGECLEILRSNVSRELNTLCRGGKIIKIKNRPVLYFDRKIFEEILDVKLPYDLE